MKKKIICLILTALMLISAMPISVFADEVADFIEENSKPLIVREHEMHHEKLKICKVASDLIKDGDFVFIDGTTTTFFLQSDGFRKIVASSPFSALSTQER